MTSNHESYGCDGRVFDDTKLMLLSSTWNDCMETIVLKATVVMMLVLL
jgi:RNase P/RNase MRP subunit p29